MRWISSSPTAWSSARRGPVPVNFRLAPSELAYILEDSESVAVLTDGQLTSLALEATAGLDAVRFVATTGDVLAGSESYEELLASGTPQAPDVDVTEDDLAFLMYTSHDSCITYPDIE